MAKSLEILIWTLLFLSIYNQHFNLFVLYVIFFGCALLYKKTKIWNFTNKFPASKFRLLNIPRTFLFNSAESFYKQISDLWVLHGRDKFRTWIGLERFLVLSKLEDVEVSAVMAAHHHLLFHFNLSS